MSKKLLFPLILVLLASTILSACGPTQTVPPEKVVTQVQVVKETAVPVKETVVTVIEPTPVPPVDRNGAWVDSVILVEEPNAAAGITRMESGELDLYAYALADRELFKRVKESSELAYVESYGSYNELTFNPSGPVFSGTQGLNPFASAKVREAMNWLLDRDYLVQEIFGGLAVPRFTAINTSMPDYAKNAGLMRAIELKYAYNPEKAKEVIDAEMTAMGAVLEGGKWTFNGEPVTLVFLIRIEDERKAIGDYISNELEKIGFTVDRQYKKSADASALWVRTDPSEGLWHLYTGGWVSTAIGRDLGSNFSFFYTDQQYPIPLFAAYVNTPEFYEVARKLYVNDFTTLDERAELFSQALTMSLEDSNRVWLNDRVSFSAQRANMTVNADLSGAVYGSNLWAYTLRRGNEIGGSVTIGLPSMMTDPWNPLAGTNWVYDRMPQRGTADAATVPDPFTGLPLPMSVERVECVIQEGLPVGTSSDWMQIEFVPSIEVPGDVWAGWDPVNQVFLTADEVFTETQTALAKCTTYYPADMFDTIKWHDGSPISIADFVMSMILTMDRGQADSPYYDEVETPNLEAFMSHFKGSKILSTDPLVIETYDDLWYLDAEYMLTSWWPYYSYGQAPWHGMVPALKAEADKVLAFSADKADALEIEWTSFIAGPSIEIMNSYLISATAEAYIPYAPTLGQYVTADEAAARYANLSEWVRTKNHYWIGTGPFYLERAFPLEGTVLLRRFQAYPYPADRWSGFSEPQIAVIEVEGEATVTIGKEATFDVYMTFKDEAYPMADVEQVTYLVLDATGQIAAMGDAVAVADGEWTVTLPADVTGKLAAGSNRLEIAAVLKVVALPAFGSLQFVTAP